jgi:RimJ/RimL family protein N-acetyltransferase
VRPYLDGCRVSNNAPSVYAGCVEIPTLTTDRLILRAPTAADLDAVAAYEADPEAMRFIADGSVYGREHAAGTLAGFLAEWPRLGHGRWTVALRASGEAVGDCGFVRWREGKPDERPELAYGYSRAAWGQGYATEAARAAVDWAFATLPFDEIVAVTHPANAASQRVLTKLGFVAAGEITSPHGRMSFFRLGRR